MKTLIHGGDIVAYDQGGHRLLRGGALVFDDDRITFVGRGDPGPVDERIDAAGHLVIPGLINIHCHADVEAGGRLIADCGRPDFFQAGFLNYNAAPRGIKNLPARQDPWIGGRVALVAMLRHGRTTVADIGTAAEEHAAIAGELGMRAYLGPAYKSYDYRVGERGELFYDLHEDAGLRALDRARAFVSTHDGSHGGRIKGMLFPFQVETCT